MADNFKVYIYYCLNYHHKQIFIKKKTQLNRFTLFDTSNLRDKETLSTRFIETNCVYLAFYV